MPSVPTPPIRDSTHILRLRHILVALSHPGNTMSHHCPNARKQTCILPKHAQTHPAHGTPTTIYTALLVPNGLGHDSVPKLVAESDPSDAKLRDVSDRRT